MTILSAVFQVKVLLFYSLLSNTTFLGRCCFYSLRTLYNENRPDEVFFCLACLFVVLTIFSLVSSMQDNETKNKIYKPNNVYIVFCTADNMWKGKHCCIVSFYVALFYFCFFILCWRWFCAPIRWFFSDSVFVSSIHILLVGVHQAIE